LDDPYEGELFVYFLCQLLATSDCDAIWRVKRAKLQAASYAGITTQRGWWFSSHEQWKLLLTPVITTSSNVAAVFEQAERARLLHAEHTRLPGLLASVNGVDGYLSAMGVTTLAFNAANTSVVTPYAAFPSLLLFDDAAAPLAYLATMLAPGGMQSRYGSLASARVADGRVALMLTWDSKGIYRFVFLCVCVCVSHRITAQ
jgi:hypothetical protein